MKKKILFISALDFKEKSIQVIKNTPVAYSESGWDVHYIVLRDSSKIGNYFYEDILNPEGLIIYRKEFPLKWLKNRINSTVLLRVLRIVSNHLAVIRLFFMSLKVLKNNKFDVVYGYECQGFLALKLLSFFRFINQEKKIARFQGTTHFNKYLSGKKWIKIFLNMHYAYYMSSDMCIMTNDGTNGKKVLENINSGHTNNLKFWINGVDELKFNIEEIKELKKVNNIENEVVFISISRLHKYKSVDRGILAIAEYVKKTGDKNFKYYIIGDGQEKSNLIALSKEKNLENNIIFVGAIAHKEVKEYLNLADVFISLYDGSNVGNPLLEAIRTHKIIFTLNKDDTSSWIQHKKNGFIFDFDEKFYANFSDELNNLLSGKYSKDKIIEEVKKTEKEKLWTWVERMKKEISIMNNLIQKNEK